MSPPEPPRVVVTTSRAALEALRPEWQRLWAETPDTTPFQSPDWLIPWWRHVGHGELLSFAFRAPADGRLIGLAPFYVHAAADALRYLFPLGIATTDYLDALVAPAFRQAVAPLLFAALRNHRDSWDICAWPQLRAGATLLEAPLPAGWAARCEPAEPCPVLSLPDRLADLADTVPAETLASLGRRRVRAAKKGTITWESAATHDPEELLEAHLRLHGARWRARGEAGVLAGAAVQAAHRDALPGLAARNALRLYALRLDGRIVATLHGFADPPGRRNRRAYLYLGGFDPAVERLSPGMLIVGHAIEEAVREGLTAVDFLRGQEPHKYAWGARDEPTWRREPRLEPAWTSPET